MHKMAMEIIKKGITEVNAVGCDNMTSEQWLDFYHAIAGASKAICAEKDYQIIEAMKKAEEDEKIEQASMRRMGYRPNAMKPYYMEEDDYTRDYIRGPSDFNHNMRMGYSDGRSDGDRYGYRGGDYVYSDRGRKYDRMDTARRHYTESKTMEHQKEFNDRLTEFMEEAKTMLMDAVKDADPNDRQMYGNQIEQLGRQMRTMK